MTGEIEWRKKLNGVLTHLWAGSSRFQCPSIRPIAHEGETLQFVKTVEKCLIPEKTKKERGETIRSQTLEQRGFYLQDLRR